MEHWKNRVIPKCEVDANGKWIIHYSARVSHKGACGARSSDTLTIAGDPDTRCTTCEACKATLSYQRAVARAVAGDAVHFRRYLNGGNIACGAASSKVTCDRGKVTCEDCQVALQYGYARRRSSGTWFVSGGLPTLGQRR